MKVPDTERYQPKWLMALEMLDELAEWGLRPPLLTADVGYGQVAEFRQGLTERGIPYIVATTSSTTAQPGDAQPVQVPCAGVSKYPTPKYPHPARSLKNLTLAHGADAAPLVRWRAWPSAQLAQFLMWSLAGDGVVMVRASPQTGLLQRTSTPARAF
ncbi:hypothetical protein B0E53_00324 [Micromonospora sp. MH33]|nr:hypothetical protein B0E53_00324 [Micromonospora sp. MH33]